MMKPIQSNADNSLQKAKELLEGFAQQLAGVPLVITGGSGFLGLSFVSLLEDFGLESDVLDLVRPGHQIAAHIDFTRTRFHEVDLCSHDQLSMIAKSLPERFVLIHIASRVGTHQRIDEQGVTDLEVESGIATNLIEVFGKRICHLVMTSSIDVFGTPCQLIDENHPENPDRTYGLGKMVAEGLFRTGAKLFQYNASILRIGHIYGPLEHVYSKSHPVRSKRAIPNFLRTALEQNPISIFGDGTDLRDFVHTWDVAQAIFRSIVLLLNDTVIIASGKSRTIRDVALAALRLCGNPEELNMRERTAPPIHYRVSIDKARRVLGYEPLVDFLDGLEQELSWMKMVGTNA